jgi:L-threonylcarbamoyladenylate synthase
MTVSATVHPSVPAAVRDHGGGGRAEDDDDENDNAVAGTLHQHNGKARMVSDLEACGKRLREGNLVAFPTETVYGLGCHALDEKAVLKVFEAKERPLSDPLIVHVLDAEDAFELWDVSSGHDNDDNASGVKPILAALCRAFWPGPLTLVAPANAARVPSCVTANTGFVACRSPSHSLARELLRHARVPLGAPSANKFGHVSPTTALHVLDDLKDEDVWIVPDSSATQSADANGGGGGCDVGVESTVAKVEAGDDGSIRIQVLRQGKVSAHDLQTCLSQAHLLPAVVETVHRSTSEDTVNVAPGQTLRHYSPNVPSFLVAAGAFEPISSLTARQHDVLQQTVIVDYGGRLLGWKSTVCAYRDLSPREDSAEAARAIFEALRWAEQRPSAKRILFPQLSAKAEEDATAPEDNRPSDSLFLAVQDRLTRAASGVVISSLDDL